MIQGKVLAIHSEHEQFNLAGRASALLEKFYDGEYLVVVHCGMLGVGFDHKWVSVSCNLCVIKSMSPAEQEWGRALRRVPGQPATAFPDLNHPNWASVVTHSALGLRELFGKFLAGVTSDVIKDAPIEKPAKAKLMAAYEAGETVLKLSNTSNVKPGDILELRVPVAVETEQSSRVSLVEELTSTNSLSPASASKPDQNPSTDDTQVEINPIQQALALTNPTSQQQAEVLPWQKEVDAIASHLHEIKSYRTCQVQVEAVLDNKQVQITPTWSDIPSGVEISKRRASWLEPSANFVDHIGLDWQILVNDQLVSYSDYKKRVVLQQKGMDLDEEGEIILGGVRLKNTLPPAAYEIFLKGLESELADASVEVPHTNAIARPDKAKLEMQARYGGQVRSLVNELFIQRGLVKDGAHGRSLVERPVALLDQAITRVIEKGHEAKFANNSALLHSATFGYIKEQTGRGWSEHSCEEQYQDAVFHARRFMLQLREQLQWRSWR